MFLLIFSNRSMYMSLLTGKNTPNFAKDTLYHFMKMVQINWMRFTTILASRIINNAMVGKEELKDGDFEIVGYKNNTKKGNAEVTIRGIGNYGGTKTVKFKIAKKTIPLFDWLR